MSQICPHCGQGFKRLASHEYRCKEKKATSSQLPSSAHRPSQSITSGSPGPSSSPYVSNVRYQAPPRQIQTQRTESQKCPDCGKSFKNLANHKICNGRGAVANPIKPACVSMQTCQDCGKRIKNLVNHKICHGRKSEATSVEPVYVEKQMCPDCGRSFKNLANHKVCRGRKPDDCAVKPALVEMQVCPDCGKCFKNLAKHKVCHGRESRTVTTNPTHAVVQKCGACGKCFKNLSNHKICHGRASAKCTRKNADVTPAQTENFMTPPSSPASQDTIPLTSPPYSPPPSLNLLTPPSTPHNVMHQYSSGDSEDEEEEEEEGEIREEESEEEGEIIEDEEEADEDQDYDEEERKGGSQRGGYAKREDSEGEEEGEYDPEGEGTIKEDDEDDDEEPDNTDDEEKKVLSVPSSQFLYQSEDEDELEEQGSVSSLRHMNPLLSDHNAGFDDEEALAVALAASVDQDQPASTGCFDIKRDADIPAHKPKPVQIPVRTEGTVRVVFDLETTGFGADSHITQLAADHDNGRFSTYVFPGLPITKGAERVTGLTVRGREMFKHNSRVTAVRIRRALALLLDYLRSLGRPALLIGHNSKSFDARVLMNTIKKCAMVDDFRQYLAGFVDTLPLLKELYPKRKSYTQFDIYVDVMGGVYDSHDAVSDVVALRDLLAVSSICQDVWERHSFSLQYVIDSLAYLKAKKSLLDTFSPLTGYVSPGMMEKMAGSGLGLQHLHLMFLRGGRGCTS